MAKTSITITRAIRTAIHQPKVPRQGELSELLEFLNPLAIFPKKRKMSKLEQIRRLQKERCLGWEGKVQRERLQGVLLQPYLLANYTYLECLLNELTSSASSVSSAALSREAKEMLSREISLVFLRLNSKDCDLGISVGGYLAIRTPSGSCGKSIDDQIEGLVNEAYVALFYLNNLRQYCLFFKYVYGLFECSRSIIDSLAEDGKRSFIETCGEPGNRFHLLEENIYGKVDVSGLTIEYASLGEVIRLLPANAAGQRALLSILYQLYLALEYASGKGIGNFPFVIQCRPVVGERTLPITHDGKQMYLQIVSFIPVFADFRTCQLVSRLVEEQKDLHRQFTQLVKERNTALFNLFGGLLPDFLNPTIEVGGSLLISTPLGPAIAVQPVPLLGPAIAIQVSQPLGPVVEAPAIVQVPQPIRPAVEAPAIVQASRSVPQIAPQIAPLSTYPRLLYLIAASLSRRLKELRIGFNATTSVTQKWLVATAMGYYSHEILTLAPEAEQASPRIFPHSAVYQVESKRIVYEGIVENAQCLKNVTYPRPPSLDENYMAMFPIIDSRYRELEAFTLPELKLTSTDLVNRLRLLSRMISNAYFFQLAPRLVDDKSREECLNKGYQKADQLRKRIILELRSVDLDKVIPYVEKPDDYTAIMAYDLFIQPICGPLRNRALAWKYAWEEIALLHPEVRDKFSVPDVDQTFRIVFTDPLVVNRR
jgi:hypothetical protein